MFKKDPGELLHKEDIEDLIKEFYRWLKDEELVKEFERWVKENWNYDKDSYNHKKRKDKLEEIIKKIKAPTLKRVAEEVKILYSRAVKDEEKEIPKDILDFFEKELGTSSSGEQKEEEKRKPIGRVAPTLYNPSTPGEFTFWVEDNENIHIEVGSIVTAYKGSVKVTGLVTDLKAITDVREIMDSFYAHGFGRPDFDMPTQIPVVVSARAEVIRRSDKRMEPIRGTWPVAFATANEIREAYGAQISPKHEVLAGFTYDDKKNTVPIGLDANYVVGYEAAHINISGASGIATKTSYALFLLYSFLAYSNKNNSGIACIAFNVKEADLMFIDELPSTWEKLDQLQKHQRWGDSVKLWFQAKEVYGLDPIRWAQEGRFSFFAPTHYSLKHKALSQRRDDKVINFNYSLKSLIEVGVGALYALFDPDDLDEKALALISSMADLAKKWGSLTSESLVKEVNKIRGRNLFNENLIKEVQGTKQESLTFENLIKKVRNTMQQSQGVWFELNGITHHRDTANKILNRLDHALDNQLKGVILKDKNIGCPIPLEKLRPGQLWVIDITQLSDKGQRFVFQTIIHTVFRLLEERKSAEITGSWEENGLQQYPKHVIIFVDELNKFVPGKESSVLKKDIIEIAARGRSIGLSLLGAQQLASKVDEEVLANTSTFSIGRSHPVEIHKPIYGWLAEGLKQKATSLDKGYILLWHALHNRPVLIHFPVPLHILKKELREE